MPVSSTLSNTETVSLLSLSVACLLIIAQTFHGDGSPLTASLAFSGLAFAASYSMICWLGPAFMRVGLKGKDMSKKSRPEIPETMGAVCAVVYLLLIIIFIVFPFYKDLVAATSGGGNRDVVLELDVEQNGRFLHRFPHNKVYLQIHCHIHSNKITARILSFGRSLPAHDCPPRLCRRSL